MRVSRIVCLSAVYAQSYGNAEKNNADFDNIFGLEKKTRLAKSDKRTHYSRLERSFFCLRFRLVGACPFFIPRGRCFWNKELEIRFLADFWDFALYKVTVH